MLHNLGHAHEVYGGKRQIDAFHRALYCYGNYRGRGVPSFGCDYKPPIWKYSCRTEAE